MVCRSWFRRKPVRTRSRGPRGNGTVVNRSAISVNPETGAADGHERPVADRARRDPLAVAAVKSTSAPAGIYVQSRPTATICGQRRVDEHGGGEVAIESSALQFTTARARSSNRVQGYEQDAHTSKNDGASLLFKISYPAGSVSTESWLKAMKFDIPEQPAGEADDVAEVVYGGAVRSQPRGLPGGVGDRQGRWYTVRCCRRCCRSRCTLFPMAARSSPKSWSCCRAAVRRPICTGKRSSPDRV